MSAADHYDVFISYAHIDNEPLVDGEPGWISSFHRVLEKRLGMLLGEQVSIWRDRELRGNDVFDDTIAEALQRAAMLVSVVTPRYVRSDYCKQELETFVAHAARLADGAPHDKARVFKVLKTPVPLEQHPESIRNLLGYDFYESDPESQKIREYRLRSSEYRDEFITTLDDLAQEITALLEVVKGGAAAAAAPEAPGSGHTVYLATTASDVREYRLNLKRDLLAQGVRVLPSEELPMSAPELEAAVARDLAQADLSIHLLGERYGVIPEASDRSDVHHQIVLSAERNELPRVIWFPPGVSPTDPRQRQLVTALQTEDAAQRGADVLETTVEELKAAVRRKLEERARARAQAQSPAPGPGGDAGPLWLYVLHGSEDEAAAAALIDHLWDLGYEVRTPLFEGDERALREEHEQNLKLCDAFVVYYGHGNELWIRKALADLKHARGLGRTKPIRGQSVYVAPPEGARKARYRTNEAKVLREAGGFQKEVLAPWLATLAEAAE